MPRKSAKPKKPKLTDTERHKRFVEVAKAHGTSDDPKAFDKAFKRIITPSRSANSR
jgi:hypothetical protein